MTDRFFIIEMVQTVSGLSVYRSPKHFKGRVVAGDPELNGCIGYYNDYGSIDQTIVYVPNIQPSHEAYLDGLPDVLSIPANLDTVITAGQVGNIRSALQAREISGNWINAGDTYRQAIRETLWVFQFMQEYTQFAGFNPLEHGVNLGATIGSVVVNNWEALKARHLDLLTQIDPDTITQSNPSGTVYHPVKAWQLVVTSEALQAGMSQENIYKCALMHLMDRAAINVAGVIPSNTFGQALRLIGNSKTNVPYVWAGAGVVV